MDIQYILSSWQTLVVFFKCTSALLNGFLAGAIAYIGPLRQCSLQCDSSELLHLDLCSYGWSLLKKRFNFSQSLGTKVKWSKNSTPANDPPKVHRATRSGWTGSQSPAHHVSAGKEIASDHSQNSPKHEINRHLIAR